MLAPALRLKEPTFRDGLVNYVAVTCRLYGIPHQDVDDLTQETLTNIVKRIGSFRDEDGEFDQWAKGVAVNVVRNYLRDLKRYLHHFSGYYPNVDDYAASDPSPERCARRNQARSAITEAVEGISSKQALVLIMHAVDDMTHKDIGHELEISESTSQKCFQRACDHVALCLSGRAFAVMPPSLAGCNDPISFNEPISSNDIASRWTERSHYAGQIVASIVALLLFVPSCLEPQKLESKTEEARVLAPVQNAAMYRYDELVVHRDAPSVKPEPAQMTSVRVVPTPTRGGDKPTYVHDLAPLPPYKHTPDARDHLLPDR